MRNATDALEKLPRELWVDHVLPYAVGPGFLPGMLGASRHARALALEVCDRVLTAQDNASPPPRAPQLAPLRRPVVLPPPPALLARAQHYEQKLRTRGG